MGNFTLAGTAVARRSPSTLATISTIGISEMSLFSPTIDAFWHQAFLDGKVLSRDGDLTIVANATLGMGRRVMVLRTADGKVYVVLTPAIAEKLGLYHQQILTEPLLRQKK